MPTPLARSYYYWIIIVVILQVWFFYRSSAFVPRSTTTSRTTSITSSSTNYKFLPVVSSPTRILVQIAATSSSKQNTKNNHNHEKWQPYYDALTDYHNHHGHCEVTVEENPSLHAWLEDQRKSYRQMKLGRKTKLTKKRAVALEMIGAIPSELLEL